MLITGDTVAVVGAYLVVALLRYHPMAGDLPWGWVALFAAITLLMHAAVATCFKLYRGRAPVGSVAETLLLSVAILAGALVAEAVNVLDGEVLVARSVPVTAGAMALVLMLVSRAAWRELSRRAGYVPAPGRARTLVVGAGDAGRQLVWSMRRSPQTMEPVGFVDDDPWKRHLRFDAVPVLGRLADMADLVRSSEIDTVVVAIPSATGEMLTEITDRLQRTGVQLKVLPSVAEMLDPRVAVTDLRDIDMADLLGRDPVDTDVAAIGDFLTGKRVLVTGAGGSIGSELSRQISRWHPSELMLLDRDESALHSTQLALHGHGLMNSEELILADIRDAETLRAIFAARRPEVVFHTAALKHLPMLERYPAEGLKTNVRGTRNVLRAAYDVGVERFVNISTDKAADPTSVLGLSKRVGERLTADYALRAGGAYISVRFGNVLGSRGSVLTAWSRQISDGRALTVTDRDVTRYFMTVAEACQLVLQAGAIGGDGEVLILDMGEPVRLDDVARKLIQLSGQRIEIVYTGLRPGEKMHEVLISATEVDYRPRHPLITHVAAPPLPEDRVLDAPRTESDDDVRALLHRWCAAEASPVAVGERSSVNGVSLPQQRCAT